MWWRRYSRVISAMQNHPIANSNNTSRENLYCLIKLKIIIFIMGLNSPQFFNVTKKEKSGTSADRNGGPAAMEASKEF